MMGYDKNREQNIASMSFYQNLLTRFVETGEKPVLDTPESDPLTVYLVDTMGDTELRAAVLNSRIAARVFVDTMVQFVSLNLQKANFRFQRSRSELQRIKESASWSVIKRQGAWNALLTELESAYGSLGFERGFYDREADLNGQDDALWESLLIDWRYYYDLRARLDKSTFINERREAQDRLLHTNLKQATRYATANSITEEGFMQTWALMGGRWNTLEFERLYRTTRLQSRYAVLKKIVNRMGRTCDDSGKRRLSVGFGRNESLPYAPHSDINGVGIGRDLGALLPSEWAQFTDSETEDVFFKKYVTGRLQTFDYRSNTLNAARSLRVHLARPKGPMIVCVDTSGSMAGEPSRIATSLMMLLAETANRQQRDCFLIAFSVNARLIDVTRDRSALLRFFKTEPGGNTDAGDTLRAVFELTRNNPRYAGADVLWITDFRMPLPNKELLGEVEALRRADTRFYGLQIGVAENRWTGYFDEIYHLTDVRTAII